MPYKIEVKGAIIPSNQQWIYDWFGMEATSPKKISEMLEKANGQDIEVEINSGGGSVFAASEIYTSLKSYRGQVEGRIVGLAASAASVIAMGCKNLSMTPTGQIMIHNSSSYAEGDYREMEHNAEILKSVNNTIANAYRIKTGKTQEELLALMDNETWMTAEKAKELGFIDEIMFENELQFSASTSLSNMIPAEIINKIQKQGINNIKLDTEDLSNEEEEIMNLDELKAKYPDLYNQAREEGAKAENKRIKEIEDLNMPGFEALVNKAKFENGDTAEKLAMDIIKAQKQKGVEYLNNVQADSQEVNSVEGSEVGDSKTDEAKTKETANLIAGFVNKIRGGN